MTLRPRLSIDDIGWGVSHVFGVPIHRSRARQSYIYTKARQVFTYLVRSHTSHSYPDISLWQGCKSHGSSSRQYREAVALIEVDGCVMFGPDQKVPFKDLVDESREAAMHAQSIRMNPDDVLDEALATIRRFMLIMARHYEELIGHEMGIHSDEMYSKLSAEYRFLSSLFDRKLSVGVKRPEDHFKLLGAMWMLPVIEQVDRDYGFEQTAH